MKRVFLLVMMFAFFEQVQGQYIGVKAGYNYASLKGDLNEGLSLSENHGFYAGLSLDFPFSKLFSFQTEALYSRVGGKISGTESGSVNLVLDYLSVPTLAKITIYRGLSASVGPQFSFLLDNSDFIFVQGSTEKIVDKKAIDFFDLAFTGGLSFKTDLGWVFDVRFVQGVTNIFDASDKSLNQAGFSPNYLFKNWYVSAGMGYVF